MGKMTIKSKAAKKKLKAAYNAELQELKEWQDNQYNPGHYVGTGRLPYPLRAIAKHPKLKWAYLLYYLIPLAIGLFFIDLVWYQVIPVVLVLAAVFYIIWDSSRTINRKNKRK